MDAVTQIRTWLGVSEDLLPDETIKVVLTEYGGDIHGACLYFKKLLEG